jgi:hypothetical protein
MKNILTLLVALSFILCGTAAFAGDSTTDCDCKKGGLGLKLGSFVIGLGVRSYNSHVECSKTIGIGLGLGSASNGLQIGFGYTDGVVGFGFAYKGTEKTYSVGLGLGYDYGDCRMVWPYEE